MDADLRNDHNFPTLPQDRRNYLLWRESIAAYRWSLVGWRKKKGHMLLPFDHGIMEHAHHARAIAHRILGYPGTHNPCEPSSPARKLEIANALLWCWYWHSWALPGYSSSQIRQISESSLFYILHLFRIFLFGGLTVLPSDLVIIGFDQARFSSCLKIHQFWDQITTFTNQGLGDMLFGAGLVT